MEVLKAYWNRVKETFAVGAIKKAENIYLKKVAVIRNKVYKGRQDLINQRLNELNYQIEDKGLRSLFPNVQKVRLLPTFLKALVSPRNFTEVELKAMGDRPKLVEVES